MQRLFNIIAEALPDQSPTESITPGAFWDSGSVVLCTVGLCILVSWLFWFGGFRALRNAPTRRHRRWFIFCPLVILFFWLLGGAVILEIIAAFKDSDTESLPDMIRYPVSAVLQIGLIAAMLVIVHKSCARQLKGFGINPGHLTKDIPLAIVHLLAVFPLILAGLWITLTLGQYLKGPDFSLEVHQSLDLLTDVGVCTQTLIAIFAVLIVPVFEELLFRGFFQTTLRSLSGSPWAAIVFTSLFFSILHPPTHIPALFMLSIGLGYAYERSGSILRPILMHVFFNGFNIAMTLLLPS